MGIEIMRLELLIKINTTIFIGGFDYVLRYFLTFNLLYSTILYFYWIV